LDRHRQRVAAFHREKTILGLMRTVLSMRATGGEGNLKKARNTWLKCFYT
jgi:hypothetical protein